MPEHQSWFTILFPALEGNIQKFLRVINKATGTDGSTWIAGEEPGVQHVIGALFVLLVVAAMAFSAQSSLRNVQTAIVPDAKLSARTFLEIFVGTIHSMMADIMGTKAAGFFLPLIGTCAFFILFSNAMGLVPGFMPPTDSLNTTVACAVIIFLATHIFGVKEHGMGHVKHLFGPWIAWWAIPINLLMFCIEIVSHLARPLSLSLRLMANMFADHMVIGVFLALAAWPLVFPVPVMLLGTLVVVVQTLVFCILSAVYIGLAVQHEEGDEHH